MEIGSYAFSNCQNLTELSIPDGSTIHDNAFRDCKALEHITLPRDLQSIEANLLFGCGNLKEIRIPKSVKNIGGGAFNSCKEITSVEIHEGVTSIGSDAFANCTNLTNVYLPSTLTTIGGHVFHNNSKEIEIHVKSRRPAAIPNGDPFDANTRICIPRGSKNAYLAVWGEKYNYVEVEMP
ncbi:MAG: leucine-rich repeat domain-containing protein [Bacteroidaceae bacterium]|nr:leucine-rich repeat domain-containing protein [Bacteroidaceae bacterium]